MKQLCLSVNEKNNFQIVGEAIQSSVVAAKEIKEKEEKNHNSPKPNSIKFLSGFVLIRLNSL